MVTNSCLIPFEASPCLSAAAGSDGKVLDANKVPHMTEAGINLLEGRVFHFFFFLGLNAEFRIPGGKLHPRTSAEMFYFNASFIYLFWCCVCLT